MLEELDEDAKLVRRCEEKRREWARHWHYDSEAQSMEDKPWRNVELKSSKEVCHTAARSYEAWCGR